ncbi:hypothetical protein [Hydrogenophaga sp. PBL-H3]|uniref:hypothetical protein n=1 Tax=Hydrogenophaga sp. PBL-H3 TaxID=434010 RepID=UPI0013202890|nr:hypothetical protein [Hydrogenophaga sp. PBL-H3]QHE76660.1 hypothetical protein F9Z45_11630 [Hydrogenophaga sp. PBL-H3]QHE81084.1 hypothetical protein F9Z44_11630 [Hydrogenophaga sp. PBL-H3]
MNLADTLNLGCACQTLSMPHLREQLETGPALDGLAARLTLSHPHLFSATAVFLDSAMAQRIGQAVAAIERVIALPAWQDQALARAPAIAALNHGPVGVFMGYDFHLTSTGPRLIEINSNAGGGVLNAALARAHSACCNAMGEVVDPRGTLESIDTVFVDMFRSEWALQRGDAPLRTVLIVDDAPDQQYLAPEFELVRELFAAHGLTALVADAADLQWRDGALHHPALPPGTPVDLVYNRLTDFYLQDEAHQALRLAHEAGAVVLTPHPRTHALYADKRNLIALSDTDLLARWGVSEADRALLQAVVPATQRVGTHNADELWAGRRGLFFKPAAGFGARAAYRGDKLTRRVWGEILAGDYVAQALVPPSERLVRVQDGTQLLKLDLRAYTYRGDVQLLAARTWTGQTTNFRTEGGGFSPVVVVPTMPAALSQNGHEVAQQFNTR